MSHGKIARSILIKAEKYTFVVMANAAQQISKTKKKNIWNSIKNGSFFRWNYCLIAFALPFLLYVSSIKNGYNLDDTLVTQNHRLTSQGISAIPEIFRSNYYADNMGYSYEYRPVVLTTFAIEHQFFGDDPHVSHFINVLLYSLLCFLLYRCLRRFFKGTSYLFSLIITLVFAFHPIHTEVVCSIKNRDELLAMLFGVLSWRYAMLFVDRKNYKDLFLMAFFFIVGILSKKSILTFGLVVPVFLLVYSGEILPTVITALVLLTCGIVVNPGVIMQHFEMLLFTAFIFVGAYVWWGNKSPDSRLRVFKPLLDLSQAIYTKASIASDDATPTLGNSSKPNVLLLWTLTVVNLVAFGIFFQKNIMLLTVPAIAAMGLFTICRIRALQILNLSVFTGIICLINLTFINNYTYLLSLSILGLLYYYNIHNLRKVFLLFGAFIILSSATKLMHMGPGGITLLALFVLHSKYDNRRMRILYAIILALIVFSFFYSYHKFAVENLVNNMGKVRLVPYVLALSFLLFSKKIKPYYAPLVITTFSLFLLIRMDGVAYKVKQKNTISIGSASIIEPRNNSRPLTFSEAPVNTGSPLRIRLGTAGVIGLNYLEKSFVPWPLGFYYGYKYVVPTDIFVAPALLGLSIYLALIIFAFYMLGRSKGLFAGIILFVAGIIAASGFFYPLPGMMADRFLFVPSLGFAIGVVTGLSLLFKTDWTNFDITPAKLSPVFKYVFIIIFVVYTGLTIARTADWKDQLTLERHDIKYLEESCQAQNLLATSLVIYSFNVYDADSQKILRREALLHFKKAIRIYPGYMNLTYDAGRTYTLLNEDDSALVYYKMAQAINDSFPDVNINIGRILLHKGLFAEAVPYIEQGIKYDPNNEYSYTQLGMALFNLKRYQESLVVTELCARRFPNPFNSYANTARIFEAMGNRDSALFYYTRAYELNSSDAGIKSAIDHLEKQK